METKDTGSSDWPEDEPQTEQKVTRRLSTVNHSDEKGECSVSTAV